MLVLILQFKCLKLKHVLKSQYQAFNFHSRKGGKTDVSHRPAFALRTVFMFRGYPKISKPFPNNASSSLHYYFCKYNCSLTFLKSHFQKKVNIILALLTPTSATNQCQIQGPIRFLQVSFTNPNLMIVALVFF